MRIFGRGILLALALATSVLRGQDFLDLPWRLSEQGRLEVQLLDDSVDAKQLKLGAWEPMFPGLFAPWGRQPAGFGHLNAWGPIMALPLLLHGEGGAAAIDEATRRMQKLGQPMAVSARLLHQLRPDPLLDLLRVQHLAGVDTFESGRALADYAHDSRRDALVRALALQALLERPYANDVSLEKPAKPAAKRSGASALQAGLTRMPDGVDLVLGIHSAVLPTAHDLLQAWRQAQQRWSGYAQMAAGTSLGIYELSRGQINFDQPGQLPYELATLFGNWRVDHALFAVQRGPTNHWWLHLGGLFQPEQIAAGLRTAHINASLDREGELRATIYGWEVRVTATELEAWSSGMQIGSRGAMQPTLHDRADHGQPPAWLYVPAAGKLLDVPAMPGASFGAHLQLASRQLHATATCADAEAATTLLKAWREWQSARRCDPETKPPGDAYWTWQQIAKAPGGLREDLQMRLIWRRCVQAIDAKQDGASVSWTLGLSTVALVDLVLLSNHAPTRLLKDG
jgi:hypothetical protein